MKHVIAAALMLAATTACTAEEKAEGDKARSTNKAGRSAAAAELQSRAERAWQSAGNGQTRIGTTLAPFAISGASLTGTTPFAWGTDSWGVE